MKKTSAKQAKKIEKRILAVVADLKKAKKARKIEHIEMAEKFLASLTAKLDVAAANLKAKKEKLIAAQEAKDNSKAQAAEYKEGGKEAKAEEKVADEGKAKEAKAVAEIGKTKPLIRDRYQRFCVNKSSKNLIYVKTVASGGNECFRSISCVKRAIKGRNVRFNGALGKIHLAANGFDGVSLTQKLQYLALTSSQVNF